MLFSDSVFGIIRIRIMCADIEQCLSKLAAGNIVLKEVVRVSDLTAELSIHRSSLKYVKQSVEKMGGEMKILRWLGMFWWLEATKKRPVLMLGVIIYICLTVYVPTRIFFVNVEGNETVSDVSIIDAASNAGVHFGVSRRSIRSEKLKNELLEEIPNLQWVGVNTQGCVATISVKERNIAIKRQSHSGISSIVADRDGIVDSVVVTRGNVLCRVGQAVREGQVLISGYTDCGITIKATSADGEVFAKTKRNLKVVFPVVHTKRGQVMDKTQKFSIIFGKKQINLYKDSGISGDSCVKMYDRYVLTLPGGFQLPITVLKETDIRYTCQESSLPNDEAYTAAKNYAQLYLNSLMVAGVVLSSTDNITIDNNVLEFHGKYDCREMIGKAFEEEILTANE